MRLMLRTWERLRQWINNICIRVYLAYVYITSFDNVASKVKTPEYVLGFMMVLWFLDLRNGTTIITIEVRWIRRALNHTKIRNKILLQLQKPQCTRPLL